MVRVDREKVTYWIHNVYDIHVLVPVGKDGRRADGLYVNEQGMSLFFASSNDQTLAKAEYLKECVNEYNGEYYRNGYTPLAYKAWLASSSGHTSLRLARDRLEQANMVSTN
jgi:hypothetical protein